MTGDFYDQLIRYSGYFNGTVLIQAHGSVGGNRYVFVKLVGNKNGLVYPTAGGVVTNPFKGMAKIYAGDLLEYDPGIEGDTGATVKLLKTYQVAAAATADATEVLITRDGYKHIPFVGDTIMVAPKTLTGTGTGVTVTAVEKTTDPKDGDVWKLTLSATLGALKAGDVLQEAAAEGAKVQAMVTNPNCFAPADYDFIFAPSTGDADLDNARYMFTPCLANEDTVLYIDRMSPIPPAVAALNTSRVNGWFSL